MFQYKEWFEKCWMPSHFIELNFPTTELLQVDSSAPNSVEEKIYELKRESNKRRVGRVSQEYTVRNAKSWWFHNFSMKQKQHVGLAIGEGLHKSGNSHIHLFDHYEHQAPDADDIKNLWDGTSGTGKRMGEAYVDRYNPLKWGIPYALGCHRYNEIYIVCPNNSRHCKNRYKAGLTCDYGKLTKLKMKAMGF